MCLKTNQKFCFLSRPQGILSCACSLEIILLSNTSGPAQGPTFTYLRLFICTPRLQSPWGPSGSHGKTTHKLEYLLYIYLLIMSFLWVISKYLFHWLLAKGKTQYRATHFLRENQLFAFSFAAVVETLMKWFSWASQERCSLRTLFVPYEVIGCSSLSFS